MVVKARHLLTNQWDARFWLLSATSVIQRLLSHVLLLAGMAKSKAWFVLLRERKTCSGAYTDPERYKLLQELKNIIQTTLHMVFVVHNSFSSFQAPSMDTLPYASFFATEVNNALCNFHVKPPDLTSRQSNLHTQPHSMPLILQQHFHLS
jgi:hypothetical protein